MIETIMELATKYVSYVSKPFVWHALVVGIMIALSSSLLGVSLVLKRYSFIGDSLSHVAFGGVSVAGILGANVAALGFLKDNKMIFALPITILCAVWLMAFGRKKMSGDASLAMISVFSLALGYVVINLFSKSGNVSGDVCSTLFGSTSILTLKDSEVWTSIGLAILVIGLFILFYTKVFAVTFDEDFAKSSGTKVKAFNIGFSIVVATIIVISMNLVGSLLVSALIIFPALSAMRIFKNFKMVTIISAVVSVLGAFFGISISILAGTPVGSTIVAVQFVIFIICFIMGGLKK